MLNLLNKSTIIITNPFSPYIPTLCIKSDANVIHTKNIGITIAILLTLFAFDNH